MLTKEMYLLTFASTHHVLRAEDLMKQAKMSLDIVPIPRTITAECGLALTFPQRAAGMVKKLMRDNQVCVKAWYCLDEQGVLVEKIFAEETMDE